MPAIVRCAAVMLVSTDISSRLSPRPVSTVGPSALHGHRRHRMYASIPARQLPKLPDFGHVAVADQKQVQVHQIGTFAPTSLHAHCGSLPMVSLIARASVD